MLTTPKAKGGLFLASSLCDGLEDNDIKQVTTLLLNKDADPNVLIPTYGVTPFHLVIGNDSEAFAEEVTKLFLRHGGNPNVKSSEGLTPVHVAAAWGRTTVLELLLANGGDALCLDDDGHSPFHYAFDGKYHKAIQVLGKYCEDSVEEEDAIKYTLVFDKLRVNNGKETAEYIPSQSLDTSSNNPLSRSESRISQELKGSSSMDECSFLPKQEIKRKIEYNTKLNILEYEAQEVIEREKVLINEIINQISTSLKVSSKGKTNNEEKRFEDTSYDLNTSFKLNKKEFANSDVRGKYNLINSAKRRSITSKFKQRILTQDYSDKKISLSPRFNPNDSIVSKSPNFLTSFDRNDRRNEQLYRKPEDKTFTPCTTRRGIHCAEEFSLGKELARSTPRRKKKLNRPCTSVKKYSSRHKQKYVESTSCDSATSLSPDQDHSRICVHNFNKNLVIKLDENKYDEAETSREVLPKNLYYTPQRRKKQFGESLDDSAEDGSDTESGAIKKELFVTPLSRSESFISIQEEYKYEDPENDVALLERRVYTLPSWNDYDLKSESIDSYRNIGLSLISKFSENDNLSNDNIKSLPEGINFPMDLQDLSNQDLRRKLIDLGDHPGPITNTTRVLYLKRLKKFNENIISPPRSYHPINENLFLVYDQWVNQIDKYDILERQAFQEFASPNPSKKWLEGTSQTSFNYLLLDPRITRDLPFRSQQFSDSETWSIFLSAIFYIGKGKQSRPYDHLYAARKVWISGSESSNKKIQRILDIWSNNSGVICLHVFHNIIPVEAYTREAAMIDALREQLEGNSRRGKYYGIMAMWNEKEKRKFGRFLLYKALQVLKHDGERQIFPLQF